jgi:hypothetical protein
VVLRKLPLALVLGIAVGVLGDVSNFFLQLSSDRTWGKWQLAVVALSMTERVLVTAGLFDLARQCTGRAHTALRIAAWSTCVLAIWMVARPLLDLVVEDKQWLFTIVYRYAYVASGVVGLVAALAIMDAGAALRRAPGYAVVLLVAVLAQGWIPVIGEAIADYMYKHKEVGAAYWFAVGAMWAVGLTGCVIQIAKTATDPVVEPAAAARGFRSLATALRFRIVASIVIAVMSLGLVKSIGMAKLVLVGGPLVILTVMVFGALGCLRAAHARVDGMPNDRLAIGGAITLWYCALQFHQLLWLYKSFTSESFSSGFERDMAQSFAIAGPLVATAGLALVGAAIWKFASIRANDALRESAAVRTLLYAVLAASAVAIQSQVYKATTENGLLVLMMVAAGATIAAVVAFASLATQAADAIDAPSLPAARVVD